MSAGSDAARAAFLERARLRLAAGVPPNVAHPAPGGQLGTGVPAVRYLRPLDDPVAAFVDAAGAVGTQVRRVGSALGGTDPLAALVSEAVAAARARTAVVTDEPETAGVADRLRALDVDVLPFTGPDAAASADLGVTGALYGIAATGSLVLHAGRAGGRTASLLPPVHLALVRADRILPEAGAFLRRMGERLPAGLPSQLVFVTGPSRSADIELVITVGVHGPKELWVGVLEG